MLRTIVAAIAAAVIAGCAAQSTNPMPAPGSPAVRAASPETVAAACKGQKKSKDYSSVIETMAAGGGNLCIPSFSRVGGHLEYPSVKPGTKVLVVATTDDYDGFPYPGSGTPLIYIKLSTDGNVSFGTKLRNGAGLVGKGITAGSTYTAFSSSQGFGNLWYAGSQCYAVAKAGRTGGIVELGSLLKGWTTGGSHGFNAFLIEVYAGQQTSTAC